MLLLLLSFSIAFIVSFYMIPRILMISIRKHLVDEPNARKVHTCSSSRLGGVAFLPGVAFAMCITISLSVLFNKPFPLISVQFLMCCAAGVMMYLVGLGDDIAGVRYRIKFVFQILAATLVVVSGAWVNNFYGVFGIHEIPKWLGWPLTAFFLIYIINAYNLIDGIDGLASGLSMIILLLYGILFVHFNSMLYAMLAFTTLGVLLPFFCFNVFGIAKKRYKIFMGDTGSLTIGLIIGFLAIQLLQDNGKTPAPTVYTLVATFSVLIVPCFDLVRVMLHRFRKGKPLFLPDKNHIHHEFIALGFSQRNTLYIILAIAYLFVGFNMLLCRLTHSLLAILLIDIFIWTILHIVLTAKIENKKSIHSTKTKTADEKKRI